MNSPQTKSQDLKFTVMSSNVEHMQRVFLHCCYKSVICLSHPSKVKTNAYIKENPDRMPQSKDIIILPQKSLKCLWGKKKKKKA